MSAAELKELRKEVKKYIDRADERAVRMVYAMLEADVEKDSEGYQLTPEQEAILDECLEQDKKGLTKYSSWEEVRARITSKKVKGSV